MAIGEGGIISPSDLEQGQGVFAKPHAAGGYVGDEPAELGPKSLTVAPDPGVNEFVDDDVVGQVGRQDGQMDVELDAPRTRGAAPERALAADAQPPGREAVLAGQGVDAFGEKRPGRPAVDPGRRVDGLAAPVAGLPDAGLGPADPGELAEGDEAGLLERGPGRQGDPDAARGANGQADPAGPSAPDEENGPDAVEREGPRELSLRNRTFSGPICC
jgi:hypothetical protein